LSAARVALIEHVTHVLGHVDALDHDARERTADAHRRAEAVDDPQIVDQAVTDLQTAKIPAAQSCTAEPVGDLGGDVPAVLAHSRSVPHPAHRRTRRLPSADNAVTCRDTRYCRSER